MQPVNKSPTSFSGGFVIGYDHAPQASHDEHRVPPEYALQKIDPASHAQPAAAANQEEGRPAGHARPTAAVDREEAHPVGQAQTTSSDNAVGWGAGGVITLRRS